MSESMVLDEVNTGGGLKLQVVRVIKASRERVFDAWTKPQFIRQWFAPGNMIVPEATSDLRVGGAYRIQMKGSIGACEGASEDVDMSHTASVTGVYKKIVPYELLSFTWQGDWDPSEETLVTVALKDVEGGTEVTLTHERFATSVSMGKHQQGWNGSLQKLVKSCEVGFDQIPTGSQ